MSDGELPVRVATIDLYPLRWVQGAWETLLLQRAVGTRCTGAWEGVHGRIEAGERPEDAAVRELLEETGFAAKKLYTTGVNPFYLPTLDAGIVTLAVVFAAVVGGSEPPRLSAEHQRAEWLDIDEARERVAWPRSRRALEEIELLLRGGDAGAVEDVLRLR